MLLIAADVLSGVRQKGQTPGTLDSRSHTSLVLSTGAGFMGRLDLAPICQKGTKKPHVLVINGVDSIYAQNAPFAPPWPEFPTLVPMPCTSSCFSPSTCQNYLLFKFRKEYR
jgi:hypothetical protein